MRSVLCLGSLTLLALVQFTSAAETSPSPPREFRGVWVATVANIDWPSNKGLSTARQQKELLAILDQAVELRLNAIVLQVRPMADALYASKLEPWSEFLTGRLGKPPEPFYDPLEFAVREAHARGLELHAWFNPYRAHHPSASSAIPDDHIVKKRPDLAKPYGKHRWMNPTHKDVQDHSITVILDVASRYDIDGVHLDDYFYPYKESDTEKKIIPFPDDDTWTDYQRGGGKLSRDDWRRDAVNRFVERMYKEVKAAKPWVKVGISPFGIWRPGNPRGIVGFDQYAELYADARLWLNEGWIDYFTPQLYWPIKQEKQSYPRLLEWWAGENKQGRHLWPGNIPSRVTGTEKGWPAVEIADQVKATRKQEGATGNIHFSMKPLMHNTGGVADALKTVYTEPALVPASPWLKDKPAGKPRLEWQGEDERRTLRIRPADDTTAGAGDGVVRLYVVRSLAGKRWTVQLQPADGAKAVTVRFAEPPEKVMVSAINRVGTESESASAGP
jgi:uncharacterized lipoprotein YddW (UPF0748 family)